MAPYQRSERMLSDTYMMAIKRYCRSTLLALWEEIISYLCPGEGERPCEANQRAEILELCNAEFSQVYRLPPELFFEVTKHVSKADVLSLHLTSRRFASLIQRTSKGCPGQIEKLELKYRLARDLYFRLAEAEAEAENLTSLEQLLCSYCRRPHPWSHFDRKEILKSGHIRCCIGASRSFKFCRHIAVKRDQLTKQDRVGLFGEYYCGPKCAICTSVYFSRTIHCPILQHFCYQNLGQSYASNTIYRDRLQQEFRRLAWQICPHMRTDDAEFQERLLSTPVEAPLWSANGHSESAANVFAEPHRGADMRIRCRHSHCKTHIRIIRIIYLGQGSTPLTAYIYRELGLMDSVQDPAWIAQLEE